ncbi:sodium/sugar symporter [soil metagenome]
MNLATIDIVVFITYCLGIISLGLWVSRTKKGVEKTSNDYFLAGNTLTWWAVGSSLIASNISAEQFIGMSGSGYAIGLGIATYEWMAAATLIVVGKFFLPIFLKLKIYTMPQFLEMRFDTRVRTTLAVFWILVYIFVNLTSVLYLGALAMQTIIGIPLIYGIIGLAVFSALYSIYGGLMAVAWTDVVQVVVLVFGGILTTYMALDAVGDGQGMLAGLTRLYEQAPYKFDMILDQDNPEYMNLPGISVLIGGMWIVNLSYWGFNQYIVQRALAAKSLGEAQRGVVFAGFLKMLMPFIVVIPGIAAYVLQADIAKPDEAYPWLLASFVSPGFRGLAFAALIAAIVSSLSSMVNSVATIFTVDIYKQFLNKKALDANLVLTGRVVSGAALFIAVLVAPMLVTLDQAFQFIQEFTGFVSPGVFAIFVFGMFWKKATSNAALWAAIVTVPLGFLIAHLFPGIPFIDRMGIVFLVLCVVIVVISLLERRGQNDPKAIDVQKSMFYTGPAFNISSIVIVVMLVVLYTLFW